MQLRIMSSLLLVLIETFLVITNVVMYLLVHVIHLNDNNTINQPSVMIILGPRQLIALVVSASDRLHVRASFKKSLDRDKLI